MLFKKLFHLTDIRTRLILVLTLILCIAFFATSYANYLVSRRAIHDEIVFSSLPLTRDNIYSETHAALMRPILISSLMANDAFLINWSTSGEREILRILDYLGQIHEKYGFNSTFFVSDKTHLYYHYKGLRKNIRPDDPHDVWYYNFIAKNKEYDLEVDTDEAHRNQLTIFINFRVEDEDKNLLGVTGVGLEVAGTAQLISAYQKKYNRVIYLTDSKGKVQIHSDPSLVNRISIHDMEGVSDFADRILMHKAEPSDFEFERNGRRVFLTARYMPELNWHLIVEQEEEAAIAPIRSSLLRNLAVGGAAILIVLTVVIFTVNQYQSKLEKMATRDLLTGLLNRRAFLERFDNAVYDHERRGRPFSIILMDLDGFKAVNDTSGHPAGDRLLSAIAGLLKSRLRQTDVLARWGGDEFIVLVNESQDQALALAERIRLGVLEMSMGKNRADASDPRGRITISQGLAQFEKGDSLDSLTRRADKALYRVKSRGGNQVMGE